MSGNWGGDEHPAVCTACWLKAHVVCFRHGCACPCRQDPELRVRPVSDEELAERLLALSDPLPEYLRGTVRPTGPDEERHGPSGDRGGHATDKEMRPPHAAVTR